MPKNYRFILLFFLALLLLLGKLEAQVKFRVVLSADSSSYNVSLFSEIGPYASIIQNFIPTATITLIAPTGQISPGALTNHKGFWSGPDMFVNPVSGLNLDYFVFTLNGAINDIVFTPGLIVPLFSFVNSGTCAGAVELMINENDPFRAQDPTVNVGNQITVFGVGQSNAYGGAHEPGSANCMGAPPCDLQIDTVNYTGISVCGATDGSIIITASIGVGTIQYSINNGIDYFTSDTFSNLTAGNYSLVVKDDNCEQVYNNNPVIITEPGIQVQLTNSSAPSCNNALDGSIAISSSGGTSPYQYSINNGANWSLDSSFTSLGNGIFTIKARNADSSCVSSFSNNPVVFSTQAIDIQVVKTNISCPSTLGGSIEITAAGGQGNFEYSIDSGLTWFPTNIFSDLTSGNYFVKVRNNGGSCENNYVNNPIAISENGLNFTVSSSNPSCNDVSNGSIMFDLGGLIGNFEFSINDGLTWVDSTNFIGLDTGSYHLRVRLQGAICETNYSSNPVILSTTPIDISVTSASGSCDSEATNSITISASGGTGDLEYSIDDGNNWLASNEFSSLSNGDYNVKVRNTDETCETTYANNPISFASSAISIEVTLTAPTCDFSVDGSISISATGGSGGFIYSIDDGVNFDNESLFSNLGNDLYNIKVRNADGTCETTYSNNPVNFNTTAISLSVSKNDASCPNSMDGQISLIGNGSSGNYEFSIDSGMTWSSTVVYQNLVVNSYYLFIRNANGTCKVSYSNNPVVVESGSCPDQNICVLEYQLTELNGVYTVHLKTDTTWTGISATTSTALVSIRVPTGSFEMDLFTNKISGVQFALTGQAINQPESLGFDYFGFSLQSSTQNIPYVKGDIVELFSFENKANCIGGEIFLIGDGAIPDPNITNSNFDAQITVSGWGNPDAPICSANIPVNICAPPSCLITYTLEENNGVFTTGMIPDTTWNALLNTVNNAQITFRIPSNGYEIENFLNAINGADFEMTSRQNSPIIELGYDYISVSLNSFGTTAIPFNKGVKVDLFSFEINGACAADTLFLVGDGSSFTIPNGENDNVNSQMTVLGWGGPDVPLCVQSEGKVLCQQSITSVSKSDESLCGVSDGTISIAASCTNDSTKYSIDNGLNYQLSPDFINLSAGNYNIKIYNATTDCELTYDQNPVMLNQGTTISFTVDAISPTCADSTNGSITFVTNNGNGSYQYSINDGVNWLLNSTFTGLGNGNYNLMVSNLDTTCMISYNPAVLSFNSVDCETDADNDGQTNIAEDVNMDGNLENDDTDMDGTPNYLDDDDDGDSIMTSIENAGPNNGDGNGDGEKDGLQSNVATIMDEGGNFRTLAISNSSCQKITAFVINPERSLNEADLNYDYPYDLNAFTIACSGTVTISLYYPNLNDFADFEYRKYGPITPGGINSEWYNFPVSTSTQIIGGALVGVVDFQLTDGQLGDATAVDGLIVDPGGLGMNILPRDTLSVEMFSGSMTNTCLTSGLPNNVGNTSVLFQGTAVTASVMNMDSCIQLVAQANFEGIDYLTVVLCDAQNANICDTTVLKLIISIPDSCFINFILEDSAGIFQVKMISDTTWLPPLNQVAAAQIVLRVPTDSFQLTNFQNGINTVNFDTVGKVTVGNYDFINISLQTANTQDIPFIAGDTVTLFSFEKGDLCSSDSLFLIGEGSPITGPDIGDEPLLSKLTVAGWGAQPVPSCVMDYGIPICTRTPIITCLYEYIIEESAGLYSVRLAVDSSITTPFNATNSILVAIRVPSSGFNVPTDSINTILAGAIFENTSGGVIIDEEEPNFAYIIFDITSPVFPTYLKGDTLDLFTFRGDSCVGDSIHLVGIGANFTNPTINGEEITSYLSIAAFLANGSGAPSCVNAQGVPVCTPISEPIPAPRDTLYFVLDFETAETVCIDSALQLLNNVGLSTITKQGTNVSVVTNNGDSCLTLTPATNFSGNDTLEVVFCDAVDTDFCDTTILIVIVNPNDSTSPPVVSCALNFEVELNEGIYTVSMTSDTTLMNTTFPNPAFPNPFIPAPTQVMDITLRAPTGQLQIVNQIDFITGVEFVLENTIISPVESPEYDYFTFGLSPNNTPSIQIPYNQGVKVDLFTFQNFNCSLDSIGVVGNGADFSTPLIGSVDISTQVEANSSSLIACVQANTILIPAFTFTAIGTNPTTGICNDGRITFIASGGTGIYEYSINNGIDWQLSNVFNDLENGTFQTIVRTTDQGCIGTTQTVVLNNTECETIQPMCDVVIDSINSVNNTCGEDNGIITVHASGSNVQYSKDDGVNFQTNNIFENLAVGSYQIVIRDGVVIVCQDTLMVTLTGTDAPIITSVVVSDSTEFGANLGIITIFATSTAGLKYSIDGGQSFFSENSFTNLGIGTYNVVITNGDESCPVIYTNNPIQINQTCEINAGTDQIICVGDSLTLAATSSVTSFIWSPAQGLSCTDCLNPIANPDTTTIYTLTSTDGNCNLSDQILITVRPIIITDFSFMTSCSDLSVQFTDNSSTEGTILAYEWDFGDNSGVSNAQNPTYFYAASSTYMVTLITTIDGGCLDSITKTVEVRNDLMEIISENKTLCAGECTTLMATGGTSYLWTSHPDLSATDIANPVVCPNETTTYYVTISNDNGCETLDSVTISIGRPNIGVAATNSSCDSNNGTITIFASFDGNPLEFQIVDNGIWLTGNSFTGLSTGDYNVRVRREGSSCITDFINNPVIIGGEAIPVIDTVFAESPTDCNIANGTITISASGDRDLIYSIDGGANWAITNQFSGLGQGNYTIQVAYSDTTCTSSTQIITLNAPSSPVILTVDGFNPTDCDNADGRINVEVQDNGVDSFEYSLDGNNWQTSNLFTNLTEGHYTIFVRYENQTCITEYPTPITLTPTTAPQISNVTSTNPTAIDANDGQVIITASGEKTIEYSIDNGVSWQLSNIFNGLDVGSYQILIRYTDQTCEISYDTIIQLSVEACFGIDNVITTLPDVCGVENGSITIIASANKTLEYSIDNGINWQLPNVFNNLGTGVYNILVRHTDLTCETAHNAPITLNAGSALIITNVSSTSPDTCENVQGSITINTNPNTDVEYSIDNGINWQLSNVFNNLGVGIYNILVRYTDLTCETAYNTPITLNAGSALTITNVTSSNPDACANVQGSLTVTTNLNTDVEYSVDNGVNWQSSNIFNNLSDGTYTISARTTDLICQTNYPIPVILATNPTVSITNVSVNNPSGCGNTNGQIAIAASGANNIEYSIDNGVNWTTFNQFNNLPDGTYFLKIRSGNCEVDYNQNPVILSSPNVFTVLNDIPNRVTCTDTFMSISVILSENINQYIINNGNITNPILNGASLTFDAIVQNLLNEYSITFSNAAGCEVTETFIIFQAQDTEADFVVIEPFCKEMEVNLLFTGTATPMANLIWELDGGILINSSPATATEPAGKEITVRWDTEGSRLIKLTVDDGGCIDDEYESIFIRKLPLSDASTDVSICMGACTQLEGSGTGVWFTWTPTAGLSATDIPNPIACPTQTTTYKLTVMSADGCVSMDSVTVNVETNFLTITPDVTICEGNATTLGVSGGTNYLWSPVESLSDPTSPNPIATPTETTTYIVVSPNSNGCLDTATLTITVNPLPNVVACEDKTICRGDSIQLIVTTHAQYAWSPTNTLINPNTGTPTAFPSETTTYTVSVIDENGCRNTDEVVVFVNSPPSVEAGNDVSICIGNSTRLNATGAITYTWTPAVGLNNPNLSNPLANPTVTTTYTVIGIDENGCESSDQVTVGVMESAGLFTGNDITICEGANAQLNVTGGSNFIWSPATGLNNQFVANPIANPTVTTTYFVTGTSVNGCPGIDMVTVFVLPNPEAIACADKTICLGDSIQLIVTTHAQYAWSPTNTLINANTGVPIAFPMQTTTYTVTVTDENGCMDTDEVIINVNNPTTVNLGPDQTLCGSGSVALDAGEGIAYQWSPSTGLSDPTIRNPIATLSNTTTYEVEVTNIDGCVGKDAIIIMVNNSPTVDAGPPVIICAGESGQLSASGGVAYQWSPTAGLSNPNIANPTVTVSQVTTYQVRVTDANGCSATDATIVMVSLPLTINPVLTPANCCGKGGSAILNVSGGFGNTTFDWSPNVSNTNTATNLAAGFYKVVITDVEGCAVVFTFEIGEDCNGCPDIFLESERCISDTTDIEEICLPIALDNIGKYEILVGGLNYLPNHGCEPENLTAYSYALVDGQGSTGMYQIENWEIDGQMFNTQVETMQELAFWMNTVDPSGNWVHNSSILTIIGGDPNKTYGTMKVIQITKWIETMLEPNITGIPTGTIIEVDVRNYLAPIEIIITDTTTCCSDTIIMKKCDVPQTCMEEIIPENQFNQNISCGETANICIAIPYNGINNYVFIANNIPFNGDIAPCDYDSMFAYTYFTLPNQGTSGPYRINSWIVNGVMNSAMFNDINGLVQVMNQIDPFGNWKLDQNTLTIQGGNPTSIYGVMEIEQINSGAIASLDINSNHIPMGTQLTFKEGNHEVLIINNLSGCRDRFSVYINCEKVDTTDMPVDTTDMPVDTTDMPVDTTDMPVDTTDMPVDTTDMPVDTTDMPVDTTDMPVDTTDMPVDTMNMTCTDFITESEMFSTVYRCDSLAAFCIDIPFEKINEYAITVDGQNYSGSISSCEGGTLLQIGVGNYNYYIEHLLSGCQDSIILGVNCQTNSREEIIIIEEGETGTYCPEPDDLVGDIIAISNACALNADSIVSIDLDSMDFCLNYEGIKQGEVRICLVLCDENGICDTTNITMLIVPTTIKKPIAVGDIDTTEQNTPIIINILANDSIFGEITNIEILLAPTFGSAVINLDNSITYSPNSEYCDSGSRETMMYGICNENGCDTAIIEILVPCTTMEILTGFSPNNDGINDFFTIRGIQAFPNNELTIFNRWGNEVFQQKGYKNKWNGTFNNKDLPDGTYFYLLKDGDGKAYSGFVQIQR